MQVIGVVFVWWLWICRYGSLGRQRRVLWERLQDHSPSMLHQGRCRFLRWSDGHCPVEALSCDPRRRGGTVYRWKESLHKFQLHRSSMFSTQEKGKKNLQFVTPVQDKHWTKQTKLAYRNPFSFSFCLEMTWYICLPCNVPDMLWLGCGVQLTLYI